MNIEQFRAAAQKAAKQLSSLDEMAENDEYIQSPDLNVSKKKSGSSADNHANSSSELSTCNYIARQQGVKKGMFLGDAIIKCPDLVVLPYDYEGFQEVSGIVADQLQLYAEQYNGCVEQVSCDEAYVEITVDPNDCQQNDIHDFVKSLAEHIRADIVKKTECTASIGIGPNKVSMVLSFILFASLQLPYSKKYTL